MRRGLTACLRIVLRAKAEEGLNVPALAIANEFIRLGIGEGRPIDPMKLQKLVYLAHGWHLAFRNQPLISDAIEAWQYGPVIPSLYTQFRRYGARVITTPGSALQEIPVLTDDVRALVQQVWKKYGGLSAIELSMFTHEAGFAWELTRKKTQADCDGYRITNDPDCERVHPAAGGA